MKTIGLVGGVSWVSTAEYYKYLNQFTNEKLGNDQYPRIILYSLNFGDIVKNNQSKDSEATCQLLIDAARRLEKAGAGVIALCANTMHMHAEKVQAEIGVPLVHIADATAREIQKKNISKVALLGTKPTMELDFYKKKLAGFGIESVVPSSEDREYIHHSIFSELTYLITKESTKAKYISIIDSAIGTGAEGVILGCTEIPLLIRQQDLEVPAFDTTVIHSRALVEFSLRQ